MLLNAYLIEPIRQKLKNAGYYRHLHVNVKPKATKNPALATSQEIRFAMNKIILDNAKKNTVTNNDLKAIDEALTKGSGYGY